jgi:hypothetical protein
MLKLRIASASSVLSERLAENLRGCIGENKGRRNENDQGEGF